MYELDLMKMKNLFSLKFTSKKILKNQLQQQKANDLEKNSQYTNIKGLISRKYEELLQFNYKRQPNKKTSNRFKQTLHQRDTDGK